jgi:pimeloyl-ACP methyl ester carboxylesterase
VFWLWVVVSLVAGLPLIAALFLTVLYFYLLHRYLDFLVRVFKEEPLFIVPRGERITGAEDVRFPSFDGLTLCGCYLRARAPRRQGVILFGLEYGSNRWACVPYCEFLLDNGFDVFAFESRGQGDSDAQPGYKPLQWVTQYEVCDVQAALSYLKRRNDADPRGIGFFGISKGGSAGLLAGSRDPYIRCFVTDGIFATRTTMVPYMRKWVAIVNTRYWIQHLLPSWYYALLADAGLRRVRRERGWRFPHVERAMRRLAPRPLLMLHGEADTYIKPDMARTLFGLAKPPKELWLVKGAKHNQALSVAAEEYRQRVLAFFQAHLADAAGGTGRAFPPAGNQVKATPQANGSPFSAAEKSKSVPGKR